MDSMTLAGGASGVSGNSRFAGNCSDKKSAAQGPRSNERSMGRLGCLGTFARGAGGIEALGEAAALAGGGVLVDRPLGRDPVQSLRRLVQLFLCLGKVAGSQSGAE